MEAHAAHPGRAAQLGEPGVDPVGVESGAVLSAEDAVLIDPGDASGEPLGRLSSLRPVIDMLRRRGEARTACVREQAPETVQLRPRTETLLDAGSEPISIGEVPGGDPESLDGEPASLVLVPGIEGVRKKRSEPSQRREQLIEVILAHKSLVARAAGASSVMTWTYAQTSVAACPANSSTRR